MISMIKGGKSYKLSNVYVRIRIYIYTFIHNIIINICIIVYMVYIYTDYHRLYLLYIYFHTLLD